MLFTQFQYNSLKRCEVGHPKSVVLVNRLNLFWNLGWEAVPEHLVGKQRLDRADIVIGCVDTRAARAVIKECTSGWDATAYWLDIGSTSDAGQFILGEPLNRVNRRCRTRLRTVAELYQETVDGSLDDDELPSCSAIQALERQSPFVNQVLAQHALALLARLFRYGNISYHGGFVNLREGGAARLAVDPSLWRRLKRRSKGKPSKT
jgi:PRTRC genetic system ThiF family protein